MNYENDIKTMLMNLGINPSLKGFAYLSEAIEITINDSKNKKHKNTTELYKEIARRLDSVDRLVERGIRHAIENAFNSENCNLYKLFENFLNFKSGKVNNATFIAVVAEKIIMNEN